jgi:hypothetical protein
MNKNIESILEQAKDIELEIDYSTNQYESWEIVVTYKHPKDWSPNFERSCVLDNETQVKQILALYDHVYVKEGIITNADEIYLSEDDICMNFADLFDDYTYNDGFQPEVYSIEIIERHDNGDSFYYKYKINS